MRTPQRLQDLYISEQVRQAVVAREKHCIVGVTPVCEQLLGPRWSRSVNEFEATRYSRQFEIQRWIDDSAKLWDGWVALDDDSSLFAPDCAQLVLCDSSVGLTENHLAQLDALLFDGVRNGGCSARAKGVGPDDQVLNRQERRKSLQLFTREMARQASIAPQLKGATSPYDCGEQEERLQCVDMVSINEASVLCGIPSAVLKRWAAGGRVLGLEHVDAGMKFPRWQFEGHMRNAIAALFEALETKDAWKVLHWIESPFDSLDGKTPRAAIEQGDVASARRVTRR